MISVTFFTDKPIKVTGLKVPLQWSKIEHLSLTDSGKDWDNTQKTVSFNELGKVAEFAPEPPNRILPIKLKELALKIGAVSDFIKYSLETTEISFPPTKMYDTSICEIKMSNISQIRFEYNWDIHSFEALRTGYAKLYKCPFSILPISGIIEPGSATNFKILFSPEEVDDFEIEFKCNIPFLSQMEAPILKVIGLSQRSLCHFVVEMSDYLSAGRRHPAYNEVLPEEIKVIEIFSRRIGVQSMKKLEVINPTSSPYEIQWKRVDENGGNSIQCLNTDALISSGKKYEFTFTYLPESVKTSETHWIFSIPEHTIYIHILVVGRIMPS